MLEQERVHGLEEGQPVPLVGQVVVGILQPDLDDGFAGIAPIGSYRPNAFGLHDTLGNVSEWCLDAFVMRGYSTLMARWTAPVNNVPNDSSTFCRGISEARARRRRRAPSAGGFSVRTTAS